MVMEPGREPIPYGHLTVSSGALCYGALHNIWHGASMPIQAFPTVRPHVSGTVTVHHIEYNTAALNGRWNAFQLIDRRSNGVVGWFVAHADTDPRSEIAKILRVSGSPYEEGSGSPINNDTTESQGVFVINRYDWGYYDKRGTNSARDGIEEDADISNEVVGAYIAVGLVDYAHARDTVRQWKEQQTSEREWNKSAWLCNPGEYMFGRFGFTADKKAARSFLFFSTHTDFSQTQLAQSPQPLLRHETPEERFKRKLEQGDDFSGLEALHRLGQPPSDRRGPYHSTEYILTTDDVAAVHGFPSTARLPRKAEERGYKFELFTPFGEGLEGAILQLVNEMFLSWLDRCILGKKPDLNADSHFTHRQEQRHVDREAYRCFNKIDQEPIPQVGVAEIRSRIAAFLHSRSWDVPDDFVAGLSRVVEYLLLEVIEIAHDEVMYSSLKKITPQVIRVAVWHDDGLYELLGHSAFYWEGVQSRPQ